MKYSFTSRIRYSEIGEDGNLTLPGLINYFQDCSTFQSEAIGEGVAELKKRGCAWVLSAWQIHVHRYPSLGEAVKITTWASGFKGFLGMRNFTMETEDGEILACANSIWSYMDMKKGRPVRPLADEVEAYGTGRPLDMEYADRKIALPEGFVECPSFPVRKYHIDTNEHVNNCQYVQMALEALEEEPVVARLRVEYKKSAVCGDIIVPHVAREEDRTVVSLQDREETPFAVVEFREKK